MHAPRPSTAWWKVSGHTAAAALTAAYGPWLLTAFLALPLIGWSRVILRDHTPAQEAAGAIVGVLAIGTIFVPLR